MTPSQKLRSIADSTGLDGIANAIREVADEIERNNAPAVPQGVPVKFLALGTRFKMSFLEDDDSDDVSVKCFNNFMHELDGRWVALVPAEDDCHRKLIAAPSQEPVTLTDSTLEDIQDRLVSISSYVADQDDRCAQAILKETLMVIAALREKEGK